MRQSTSESWRRVRSRKSPHWRWIGTGRMISRGDRRDVVGMASREICEIVHHMPGCRRRIEVTDCAVGGGRGGRRTETVSIHERQKTMTIQKTTTKKSTPKKTSSTKAPAKATTNKKPITKAPAKKLSAINAAAKVLAETKEPLNAQQMIEQMAAKGYWRSPGGKTPSATLYASILREIKHRGKESRFQKVDRGLFALSSGK